MKKTIFVCLMLMVSFTGVYAQEQPGLAVGVQAPDFEAITHDDDSIKLSDYFSSGPVVLLFYRGGWCPYCNTQLQEYQKHIEDFGQYNATIIAVSVDTVSKAAATAAEKKLGFELISDPKAAILQSYGLGYKVPDELNKKYKEEYNIDLEASSGQTHHMIAIPATYVIDQKGAIVYAYANEDYKVRPKAEEILKVLAVLKISIK